MTRHRARDIADLQARFAVFDDEAARQYWQAFRPRSSDVFVTTFPKCGTTWMQQIVHGLRTRGDMSFDEITAAVPWLEVAYHLGIYLEATQTPEPRAFKTHLSAEEVPRGGRYIVVIRDYKDACVSIYRFMEGWFFEPGAISITEYVREEILGRTGSDCYWDHLASWLERCFDEDVLMLCYEDMRQDLSNAVERVAAFIGIDLDDDLKRIVLHQSSIEFMSAHASQFDDHLVREAFDESAGLPPGGDSAKVRTGRVGDYTRELPAEVALALDRAWREKIQARFGFASYQALRRHLADSAP